MTILLTLAILNRRAAWAADIEINVKSGLWEVHENSSVVGSFPFRKGV
jgi:hypothetical protein